MCYWCIVSGSSWRSKSYISVVGCWLLTTDLSQPSLERIGIGLPHIWREELFSHENGMCRSVWWICSVFGKNCQNSGEWSLAYKDNIWCFFQKIVMKTLFQGLLWALWRQYGIIPISNNKQIIQWPSPLLPLLSYLCSNSEHTHSNSCHTLVDAAQIAKIIGNICGHVINKHILMP